MAHLRAIGIGTADSPTDPPIRDDPLPKKYDNGNDKTDGPSRFPLIGLVGLKRIFRTDPRGFSMAHQRTGSYFILVALPLFFSLLTARRISLAGHREAIILERTQNSRKRNSLLRREGELMNGWRSTDSLEFRRVCANRIIFVCGGESLIVA